ncbi:MAG: class III poly(R)-hydroxyalkanoic acid synthase subunit PhaC [Tissierellia bacterium]|nr:class III poly(R)-hydroxyalkanoic acid synthase subunit PhaC [Tissierellia bacterium]
MTEKILETNEKYLEKIQQSFEEMTNANEQLFKGLETFMNLEVEGTNATEREQVFSQDKMKLYHYAKRTRTQHKVPTLVVYALVNTPAMMDIQEDKSFIKNILEGGTDIYLIEWGYPTPEDKYITLEDYIQGYINEAVEFIKKDKGVDKVNIMGICQGGTFSTIYTALNPEKIQNLVTIVTPIDFSTNDGLLFKWSKNINADLMVQAYGNIPGEFMNNGFLTLKPLSLMVNKYLDLVDDLGDSTAIANFMRMEKWIFDSPAQVGEAYRQFINDMYHENKLIKGELEIGGKKVDLKNINMPLLNVYATKDHQVPVEAAKDLEKYVSSLDKETHPIQTGHIGMFVSGRSAKEVAPLISNWLKERSKK